MTSEELIKNYVARERKRKAKKFTIIIFPIGIVLLVLLILLIPTFSRSSCFDNEKNGQEEGVDCGGDCIPCGIKNAEPLKLISVDNLAETDDFSGVLFKVKNNNTDYGNEFDYKIVIKDSLGQELFSSEGSSFIYPSTVKYIVHPKISLKKSEMNRIQVDFSEGDWFEADINPSRLFSVVETKGVRIEDASQPGYLKVTGRLVNRITSPFKEVDLVILLYSKTGEVLAAAQTQIFNLESAEIRDFEYTWLNYFPGIEQVDLNRIEVYPDALSD